MTTDSKSCMDDHDPDSLSIENAKALILDLVKPITDFQTLLLTDAYDRILAIDVVSQIRVPAGRNSAMDGYALIHGDLNSNKDTSLTLVGKSLAGHPWPGTLKPGEAIRITTGALIPNGADCVIMQEVVTVKDNHIHIKGQHSKHQYIREAGSDIDLSEKVLKRGCKLGAAELGLLAAIGKSSVEVVRQPRVAIFSTGDELVSPGQNPEYGQIFDSNRFTLTGLLKKTGAEILDLGIVADTQKALEKAFEQSREADLIISTGGVSVGEADYVRQVLQSMGKLHMWKIAMKPGRPLTVGKLNSGSLFFGLPGNPVSGMVTFHLFVAAALRKIQAIDQHTDLVFPAICTNKLNKLPGRVEFQRGILSTNGKGNWEVATTGLQDSHVLTSMHLANCYIILDLESRGAEEGEVVKVMPFETYI